MTDVIGYSHVFTYDNSGKLISQSAPGGVLDSYLYDADDNLRHHDVSNTVGGISVDSLSYDARGKIDTATSSSFGTATITTMYDGLGAVIGEETNSTVEGTTQETFVVDALGNRTRRRQLLNDDGGGDDFQHQRLFEYDGAGKMTRITTPTGLFQNFMHGGLQLRSGREHHVGSHSGNSRRRPAGSRLACILLLRRQQAACVQQENWNRQLE